MSKERPYEFISTYALAILISEYQQLVNVGFDKLQKDLKLMLEEMKRRNEDKQEDRQVTIEEYMRSRENE